VAELRRRNRELAEHARVRGVLAWNRPFPATGSHKLRREALVEELRGIDRTAVRPLEE
jgi:hypothetical protein